MAGKENEDLKWGCCSVGLQDQNYITCSKCAFAYHVECLSSSCDQEKPTTSAWTCPLCLGTQSKGNDDNMSTPVRYNPNITVRPGKRQALTSPPNEKPVTRDEMQDIIQGVMVQFHQTMRTTIEEILGAKLKSLKDEIKNVKDEIKDVKDSMDFMNTKYEAINREHADSSEKIKSLETENSAMQSKIADLSNRVNQMEQKARMNNIEIQCMPERKDENLLSIITELGKSINCPVSQEHLAHYTRITKVNKDSKRPKSIVVQFNSPRMRDQFLAATIKFNKSKPQDKLNSSHAGIPGARTPIFVCEHLSTNNKALHAAARQAAKTKCYKYVWVRSGRIYMRKTDNSDYKLIRDFDTLNKLT